MQRKLQKIELNHFLIEREILRLWPIEKSAIKRKQRDGMHKRFRLANFKVEAVQDFDAILITLFITLMHQWSSNNLLKIWISIYERNRIKSHEYTPLKTSTAAFKSCKGKQHLKHAKQHLCTNSKRFSCKIMCAYI